MTSTSVVRTAVPEDYADLWRLFLSAYKENALFKIAPEKVDWLLKRILSPELIPEYDTGPRGIIGVIGPVANLEGMVLLMIGKFWYSDEFHLEEYIIYTDPEHRRSHHAKELIKWMKMQSDLTGLPVLTGIISNKRTEAKCSLYRRMLPKVGEFFFYTSAGKGSQVVIASS